MRLIDADDLKKTYYRELNIEPGETGARFMGFGMLPRMIDRARTVDPVRRGRWVDTGSGQECSVCHEIQYGYDNYRYYCPFCGAKMGEEE